MYCPHPPHSCHCLARLAPAIVRLDTLVREVLLAPDAFPGLLLHRALYGYLWREFNTSDYSIGIFKQGLQVGADGQVGDGHADFEHFDLAC